MFTFILGALSGGLAAWWWRHDIQRYMNEKLPNVREKTADRLAAIEQRAEGALGKARAQIDRMRATGDERMREARDISSATRTGTSHPGAGSYTHGTGSGV